MNTKTIFSAQYEGNRFQLIEVGYSSQFVTYSILQNRRVIKSRLIGRRCAMLEFNNVLRLKIINGEIS